MDTSFQRRTAWLVAAVVFDGLLISGVVWWVGSINHPVDAPLPTNIVPTTSEAVSSTPTTVPTQTGSVSPSATPIVSEAAPAVFSIADQKKQVNWNEISFKYPGNWIPGDIQDAKAGITFTSTTKEDIQMNCPHPEIGFEGWDFDHPMMKLEQTIPGTNNLYKKSLVIAQPVLQWNADGKAVLDPKNKKGLGWLSMMTITKVPDPSKVSSYGCMVRASFSHVPTGTEKQSLQTMYNSVVVDSTSRANNVADIIRYINQSYTFSMDFPKSWGKIKEENLTDTFNQAVPNNPKPYTAVLKLSAEGAPEKSAQKVFLYIYGAKQLSAKPEQVDVAGVTYLTKSNQYGYYAGGGCDAVMADTPGCQNSLDLKATNTEIQNIIDSFKLTSH